jgi:SIR2-like domain
MHSQAILGAPVTLFLGAGASKPLGKLLMVEFIDYVAQERGFKHDPLFQAIVTKEKDLEFAFEELQDWGSKRYMANESALDSYRSFKLSRMSIPGVQQNPEPFDIELAGVVQDAERLQLDLRREVFTHYRHVESADTDPVFAPLFDLAFENINPNTTPLVVFTTNYDPAVEEFCNIRSADYALEDGFFLNAPARRYEWKKSQFDEFRLTDNKRNIVLFKLHGSADWIKMRGACVKAPPFFADDKSGYENILIYPARRKVAIAEPFFTAYDYFQRIMEKTRLCIVIGYSFRDYDALTKLMSAATANPHLRLAVIDPQAPSRCKTLKSHGIQGEPITKQFGNPADAPAILDSLRTIASKTSPLR